MNGRFAAWTGAALMTWMLASCAATKVSSLKKDPGFDPKALHRTLVLAVTRKPATQTMLEDEFARNLKKRGNDAVASHTLVPAGTKLDLDGWKRIVSEHHFDAVIVSRVVDVEVIQKEMAPMYIENANQVGGVGGYRYYNMSEEYTYHPGYSYRKETAVVETRVFEAAGDKQMWSAHTRTDLESGGDPEPQIRDFVDHMVGEIYR